MSRRLLADMALRRVVQRMIKELGISETARRLGIGRDSVKRIANGERVMIATLRHALIEERLSRLEEQVASLQIALPRGIPA